MASAGLVHVGQFLLAVFSFLDNDQQERYSFICAVYRTLYLIIVVGCTVLGWKAAMGAERKPLKIKAFEYFVLFSFIGPAVLSLFVIIDKTDKPLLLVAAFCLLTQCTLQSVFYFFAKSVKAPFKATEGINDSRNFLKQSVFLK